MAADGGAERLRVTLETDGGFAAIPGLRRAVAVDAAALDGAGRAELAALVAALPAEAPAPDGAVRDGRRYALTVEGQDAERRLAFADPVGDPALRALRDFVRARGGAAGGAGGTA